MGMSSKQVRDASWFDDDESVKSGGKPCHQGEFPELIWPWNVEDGPLADMTLSPSQGEILEILKFGC